MNQRQKIAMWVAITVITLILAFPPWRYIHRQPYLQYNGPYSFVLRPPKPAVESKDYETEWFREYEREDWTAEIDYKRMLIPFVIVSVLGVGVIISLHNKS